MYRLKYTSSNTNDMINTKDKYYCITQNYNFWIDKDKAKALLKSLRLCID